jgi:hypothetical protein
MARRPKKWIALYKAVDIWAIESNQDQVELKAKALIEEMKKQMGEKAFEALLKRCEESPRQKISA